MADPLDTGTEPDMGWPPPAEGVFGFQFRGSSFEQFDGNILTTISEKGYAVAVTGGALASVMTPAAPDKADGAAQLILPVSLGAPSGASLTQNPFTFQDNALDGVVRHVVRLNIDVLPELGTQEARFFHGLALPSATQLEPTDGFYFYFDHLLTNWRISHRRAGVLTSQDTFFPPVAGAWQTLGFEIQIRNGLIQAYGADDGNILQPIGRPVVPANIQADADLASLAAGSGIGTVESTTNCFLDYIGWDHVYGAPR